MIYLFLTENRIAYWSVLIWMLVFKFLHLHIYVVKGELKTFSYINLWTLLFSWYNINNTIDPQNYVEDVQIYTYINLN
jgi:hypothetical protein